MASKFRELVKNKPLFIYLMPIFFVLHGYTYYYNLVNVLIAIAILAAYVAFSRVLVWISKKLFKDHYRANLFAFVLIFVNFYFGYLYEGLNNINKRAWFAKYSTLFLFTALILVAIFFLLRKRKKIPARIGYALNFILLGLIAVETGTMILKFLSPNHFALQLDRSTTTICKNCEKPNIYLIMADGYAGFRQLNDSFNFDNSGFEKELTNRGFHYIKNTRSNYNFTVLSVASVLNMSYLSINKNSENKNTTGALRAIRRSQVIHFMKENGYEVHNNSIFRIDEGESRQAVIFPVSTALVLGSTLVYHLTKIIEYRLAGNSERVVLNDGKLTTMRRLNNLNYNETVRLSKSKSTTPRFSYTHLIMPHFPYFYDKDGKETASETIQYENRTSKKDYLEYLKYASKRLLSVVDSIRANEAKPPIIVVMSDHGFREFDGEPADKSYLFCNICAVYLPNGDYSGFYDEMSLVNVFRALLNSQFKQKLPMLKDSTIFSEPYKW